MAEKSPCERHPFFFFFLETLNLVLVIAQQPKLLKEVHDDGDRGH